MTRIELPIERMPSIAVQRGRKLELHWRRVQKWSRALPARVPAKNNVNDDRHDVGNSDGIGDECHEMYASVQGTFALDGKCDGIAVGIDRTEGAKAGLHEDLGRLASRAA